MLIIFVFYSVGKKNNLQCVVVLLWAKKLSYNGFGLGEGGV
jgi:hypothetical protein